MVLILFRYCCATVSAAFFDMSFIAVLVTELFKTPRCPRLLIVLPIVFFSVEAMAFSMFRWYCVGMVPAAKPARAAFAPFAAESYRDERLPKSPFAVFEAVPYCDEYVLFALFAASAAVPYCEEIFPKSPFAVFEAAPYCDK